MKRGISLILGAVLLLDYATSCALYSARSYQGVGRGDDYWLHIEKNGLYVLKTDVNFLERRNSRFPDWWDGEADPEGDYEYWHNELSKRHNMPEFHRWKKRLRDGQLRLAKGTLLRIDRVYEDTEPFRWHLQDYTAVVESGEHAGKRVNIEDLLKNSVQSPDAKRVRPDLLERVRQN